MKVAFGLGCFLELRHASFYVDADLIFDNIGSVHEFKEGNAVRFKHELVTAGDFDRNEPLDSELKRYLTEKL